MNCKFPIFINGLVSQLHFFQPSLGLYQIASTKKTKGTLIIESPCFSKYNDQFFSWYDAMLDDSVSFASPLIDERQKTRIEHCNATMINAILTSAKGGYRNMRRTRRK